MSVIQSIREKYAKWAVVAIALALLGFILTDYFTAQNRMFGGGSSTTLGSVNGKKIEFLDFETKLKNAEQLLQAQGQSLDENQRHQNNERLWNQEVEQIILNAEFGKLGITVGKRELNDYLFGANPPPDLRQRFSDSLGNYNPAAAQEFINQLRRSTNQTDRDQLNSYLASVEYNRQVEKYTSLLSNSVYFPKWYIEKQNTEASALAKAAYVVYPYSKIADSSIQVSDKEIEEYINKNKEQYRIEESRSIAYVVFDAAPTAGDSAAVKKQLEDLKTEFDAATDPAVFLARYGSTFQYSDVYNSKSLIQVPNKDSIFSLSKNGIFGPYLDEGSGRGSYVMAKKIDEKNLPDTVKCRHVLISTDVTQGGFEDSVASKKIDSVKNAINGGASWPDMVQRYNPQSDGSRQQNGEMTFASNEIQQPNFAKEFAQFILFDGKKGEKKVVKTSFGYHFIEVMEQKNFQPHYKVAYFAKNIVPSDETDRVALEAASRFASESRDLKSFDANIEKMKAQGYQKFTAAFIRPNDIMIQGINAYGTSRNLVREIYKAGKGDVLQQERVGDKYIVVAITDVFKEGTAPVSLVRPSSEIPLRNKKKAEQIKQKFGKFSSLDEALANLKDTTIKTTVVDSLRYSGGALGFEPKIAGAIFNQANKGKLIPEPLAGQQGVYVVRVDDLTTTSITAADIETQRAQLAQRAKQMQNAYSSPITLLRKLAKIKDNRSNFY
jgi:peptidyl-prolyl cis-trans isomerase D